MRHAISCAVTQLTANIKVLEHVIAVLRGLRIGPDVAVAEAAVQRERKCEAELLQLRKQENQQPELFNAVPEEPVPAAVNFSIQPQEEEL